MSKIGYIRVSTEHQETARQQEIMCGYQVDRGSVSSSNSVSVRASRLLKRRASTQAESPPRSTGQGSVNFMGNGSPSASLAGTLCGEWDCRLTLSIAVSGSMKRNTELQSRPLLDTPLRRTEKPHRAIRACGAENYNHLKRKALRNACR